MTTTLRLVLRTGLFGLVLAAEPPAVHAADECNGFINISYPGAPPQSQVGDVLTVRFDLGTGTITGGAMNVLEINELSFDLDCPQDMLFPGCPDTEGPIVSYLGDATISTNCPLLPWTSNNPGGGPVPNHLVFTAVPPFDIPAGTPIPPGFCFLEFDIQILAPPVDGTAIEQIVGYENAMCDNGVLLSGGFQTGSIPVLIEANHFQCYETPRRNTTKPNELVSVTDQFGSDPSIRVVRAQDLCAPVDKNGEDPDAPFSATHFTRYLVDQVNSAAFPTVEDVTVINQFGTFLVDVKQPDHLLVPTAKSVMPAPPPAPLAPDAADHYLCHRVDVKDQPDLKAINLTLIDQFSQPGSYAMKLDRVERLCAPVSKNGAPILDPLAHLLCFVTNPPKGLGPLGLELNLVNQFFAFNPVEVEVTRLQEFCVESSKILP